MKNVKKLYVAFLFCLLSQLNCSSNRFVVHEDCIANIFDSILEKDHTSILHPIREELLLVTNYSNTVINNLKITLIPKESYSKYLFLFDDIVQPKGTYTYKGVTVLVYGKSYLQKIKLQAIDDDADFLRPYVPSSPPKGFPPYPPPSIEPLIYSYYFKDNCFELRRKSVAENLFD